MSNPILDRINRQSGNPQQNQASYLNDPQFLAAKRLYKLVQGSSNPNATIQSLISQNPQMQQIIGKNNNLQQVFYNLANQRGIDPNVFINELLK